MDTQKRKELIKKIEYEIHVLSRLKESLQNDEQTVSQQEVEEHFMKRREARNRKNPA